jgi:hypothetical protein
MTNPAKQQQLLTLPAGTVLRVSHGWYDHVGLLSDRYSVGERAVMSFSAQAGGFLEEPYSTFARNQAVSVDGYLGTLPPWMVLQRARMKAGGLYSWTTFNCEHFVRFAHGIPIESPQLQRWTFALGSVSFLAVAFRGA